MLCSFLSPPNARINFLITQHGVLGKIESPMLQEAVAICSVENQIRKLRETLTAIKAVLLDAEEQ